MLNVYPSKERRAQIIKLALPIIFGMLSINIVDIVDTAMIGQLGDAALAGTGFASFLFWVCFSAIIGFSGAVQSMISRRLGENKLDQCGEPLNAGLLVATLYAIPVSIIMVLLAPWIFSFFSEDALVHEISVTYFRWRAVGILAICYTLNFRGFWNGIKEPNTYTFILVGTHVLNVFLNWLLIFGHWGFPEWGVKGAAIASTLALYSGAVVYVLYTTAKRSSMYVLRRWPRKEVLSTLFRVGLPVAIDSTLFSLNLFTLFWIFSQIGTAAAAVAHVVIVCVLLMWLPGMGLGMASLTLVSESLGKGDPKEAKQWAWDVIYFGIPFIAAVGLFFFCFPQLVIQQFIHDPQTAAMAVFPLRLDLLTLWTACIGVIFMESLTGAGATQWIMRIKVVSRWIFFLPIAYWIGVHLGHGLNGVWIWWVFVTVVEVFIFAFLWQRERWMGIKV